MGNVEREVGVGVYVEIGIEELLDHHFDLIFCALEYIFLLHQLLLQIHKLPLIG